MKKQSNAIIGIYKIQSPTGKVYVGQSINIEKRRYAYSGAKCVNQPKIYNSITKHGWGLHTHEILEECTSESLNERELYWKEYFVKQLGWDNVLFCDLSDTNISGPRSEEIKQKLRDAMKGRKVPREVVERQKETKKLNGYQHPKIECPHCMLVASLPNIIHYHLDNCTKNPNNPNKIRKGVRIGKKGLNPKAVEQWGKDGEFIKEWNTQWDARDFFKLKGDGIGACCRGEQKSAGGFIWKYKN